MNHFIEAEPLYYTEQVIEEPIYSNIYGHYEFVADEEV